MSGENKFISNQPSVLSTVNSMRTIQIGVVAAIDDEDGLGRIKVRIPGPANKGGDDGIAIDALPWSYPMNPKYFTSTPRIGEGVFVMILSDQKTHSDRLYFGPIISQLSNLNNDPVSSTALAPFTFAVTNPKNSPSRISALNGVFPKIDDIAIQGRYNTDLLFRTNEILMRAGKFEDSPPNINNPYPFQFNTSTTGYFHVRNNVPLARPVENTPQPIGSVVNIVGNKVNILTHADGSPRYNLTNQEDQISNDEILNILDTAHQLPFGDILLEYLILLKNAFINHVHNGNKPTDLTADGAKQYVAEFKKTAEDLENRMLSSNIRIN
jgi:hypothetical protein